MDSYMTKVIPIRNERGQATTEFALVLPILCLLLFAVIQFGIAFNHYLALTDAVRAGSRKAAVARHLSDPEGTTKAEVRKAAPDLKQSDLEITVTSTWQHADDVTVTATYPYQISLLGMVFKEGRLTSTTTERVE
jgi:Flp pilus assembly protein TadG